MKSIYTIGHSNLELEKFLQLLQDNKIQLLVDVRSSPYSKYVPSYNRENLKDSLKEYNIKYVFLGDKIGGKPKESIYYQDGVVNYELIAQGFPYKEGLLQLIKLTSMYSVSIMCSEEDPYKCHRHNLISQTLLKEGFKINHIRGNGKLEKLTKAKKKDVQTTLF